MTFFLRILLLFACLEQGASANETNPPLRFESTLDLGSKSGGQVAASIASILNQYSIPHRIERLPMQRGIEEIKKQRVGGSIARIYNFAQIYDIPDYERVNFPILNFTLILVCNPKLEQKVKGEGIVPLKLGFLLGSTLALQVVKYIDRSDVTSVRFNNYRSGISMLTNSRIDCLIGSDSVMEEAGIEAKELEPFRINAILAYELYIWLAKRYSQVKLILERELPKFHFTDDWVKKYRSKKSICTPLPNVICPDGIIFTRRQNFEPKD